ncbi:MAG TPA: hypothetical protein VD866_18185 [Urbifossiella sp.]|nr:hypothetical protein [Urbifossiella sp.]
MRTRPLLATALVVLSVGVAHAWPPLASRPAPVQTLDQLIDRLAELRAQELELHVRRADLERQVGDRLAEQARRLEKVGVSPAAAAPPLLPPAVLVAPTPSPAAVVIPVSVALPPTPVNQVDTGFVAGSEENVIRTNWDREPRWTLPGSLTGELADRIDALGGMPLAYTRWQRDTAPRRATQMFSAGYVGVFGGN